MAATAANCVQLMDDIMLNAEIIAGLNILPTLLTIIGNSIFLITFIKTKALQTPSNLMLAALCMADLQVGLIYEPIFLVYLFSIRYDYQSRPLNFTYFVTFSFCAALSGTYSFVITLDRYVAICFPLWYHRFVTCKQYLVVIVSIACSVLAFNVITVATQSRQALNVESYASTLLGILAAVMLSVILMYCRIFKVASRQSRVTNLGTFDGDKKNEDIRQRTRERKKAYTVGIVLGIWIASVLPFLSKLIFTLTRNSEYCKDAAMILKFDMWAKFFTVLSSFANPFVYCYRSKEIRKAAFKIFWPKRGENTTNVD
eukprot:Seg935.6 transcript_id=Seg935.6/GoldUCD/mRNA.D3Y31 product="Trace amine-associated receptor 9" protein_id=Seg935.6/GoldUCD/D3Y31